MVDESAYERITGTAAGSAALFSGRKGNFKRVVITDSNAGTVSFHDADGTANAAAGNLLFTVDNAQSTPVVIDIECRMQDGLVYEKSGNTDMVVIYD